MESGKLLQETKSPLSLRDEPSPTFEARIARTNAPSSLVKVEILNSITSQRVKWRKGALRLAPPPHEG